MCKASGGVGGGPGVSTVLPARNALSRAMRCPPRAMRWLRVVRCLRAMCCRERWVDRACCDDSDEQGGCAICAGSEHSDNCRLAVPCGCSDGAEARRQAKYGGASLTL